MRTMLISAILLAVGLSAPAPAAAQTPYTVSSGFEFYPLVNTYEYLKGPAFLVFNGALVSLTAGSAFESQLQLPHDARLSSLDIFGSHDHSTQPLVITFVERCLPFLTGGNPTETLLGTSTINDQDGSFAASMPLDVTIDNRLCTYHTRARFGDGAGAVPSVLIQLSKVRAEWASPIFVDGFESGNTSGWSSAVP